MAVLRRSKSDWVFIGIGGDFDRNTHELYIVKNLLARGFDKFFAECGRYYGHFWTQLFLNNFWSGRLHTLDSNDFETKVELSINFLAHVCI